MFFVCDEFCILKDDESLRKWKEQLLGNVDVSAVGGTDFIITYLFSRSIMFIQILTVTNGQDLSALAGWLKSI